MSEIPIEIQLRADGQFVDATLLDGMAPADLLVVENEWSTERSAILQHLLKAGVPRPKWPQSLTWDWKRKVPQLTLLETSGFGIVHGGRWQGVMLTKTSTAFTRLSPDKGRPLVYVDFLEVAPRNWTISEIGRVGQFRAIGSTLFWRAVMQSEEEGFHGRVGLHSLPQSESFYEKVCGMTAVERDPSKQNLLYFEFTRDQARRYLQQGEQT